MTRQQVLAFIQAELAKEAEKQGVAVEDSPKAFGFVITETLTWLGESKDSKVMAGLATYFAYRLFYAKQVTTGATPTADFQSALDKATEWTIKAGYNFAGGDA